ncbi:MAG: hypothetical protein FWG87_03765 [Defluviitaleaceae bacterium]|nr:hypothetical protein [Defluviitaleaceae bacterium]
MIGRCPSQIDERAYLGADKSAPYNTVRRTRLHGFKNTPEKIRGNPLNPRKSAFHAFK